MMPKTLDDNDWLASPAGPYDDTTVPPWFLRDDAGDAGDLAALPHGDRRPLIDPGDWAAAQAALAAELAEVAVLYGALEERLRSGPAGWRHRLALIEASELSWAVGDRVSAQQLGLWQVLRLSGVQEDALGLTRAAWALRRLAGTEPVGLVDFFDRKAGGGPHPSGPDDVADMGALMGQLGGLHPVVQAVALAQGWLMLGAGGPAGQIEAMVLAGRLAARMGRGQGFVPQAMSGVRVGGRGRGAHDRLAGWLVGAARATQAALLHLDRVTAWQGRATAALSGLQGRTPALLLAVLNEWPMVTSPMAQTLTKANPATVLRNLEGMQGRGLVREVTGQGRYRVWTALI